MICPAPGSVSWRRSAGALAITLLGGVDLAAAPPRGSRPLSVFTAFGGAVAAFVGLLGRDPEEREQVTTAWTWLGGRETSTSASRCSSTRSR